MLHNIIDSHAHYNDAQFDADREEILTGLTDAGIIKIINCGTDVPSSKESMRLAEAYPHVFFSAGVHPEDCAKSEAETDLEAIQKLLLHDKCVAVGEIGLDYYWKEVPRDLQRLFFERQLSIANESNLPVIIHDREAHGDMMEILRRFRPAGVLHCYSGSAEFMREYVSMGLYIGVGGSVTFKNAKKTLDVAAVVPLDHLLLETDCPYMAPVPFRGKKNSSAFIPYIAEKIAELRDMDAQTLIDITTENAKKLFFRE